MASAQREQPSEHLSWRPVVGAIAAAAGGAAWVSAIGSSIIAMRLQHAELPANSVVALMPAEHRFAIGASYLIAPLFVGLVGFLADLTLTAKDDDGADRRLAQRLPLALATIAVGTILGALLLQPPLLWIFLIQNAAILVVVFAVLKLTPQAGRRVGERLVVFLLVLVSAGALALLFERLRPATFDFATVELKDRSSIAGYYVTATSDRVILITFGGRYDHEQCAAMRDSSRRVIGIPSAEIERISIGPADVKVNVADYCHQAARAQS